MVPSHDKLTMRLLLHISVAAISATVAPRLTNGIEAASSAVRYSGRSTKTDDSKMDKPKPVWSTTIARHPMGQNADGAGRVVSSADLLHPVLT